MFRYALQGSSVQLPLTICPNLSFKLQGPGLYHLGKHADLTACTGLG